MEPVIHVSAGLAEVEFGVCSEGLLLRRCKRGEIFILWMDTGAVETVLRPKKFRTEPERNPHLRVRWAWWSIQAF